jgi:anti-anti-sigma factor
MTESADGLGARTTWHGRVAVTTVSGDLDMLTAPRLTESMDSAIAANPTALVVDLSRVTFLASAGMDVLFVAHRRITPSARFAIVADGRATRRPLELMGLHDVLEIFTTVESALLTLADA